MLSPESRAVAIDFLRPPAGYELDQAVLTNTCCKRWGDEGYAREELVAELGSAFLCADLELALEPREDYASYIESWLKVLKDDKRAIFSAAAHGQRAADYLHSLQRKAETEAAA